MKTLSKNSMLISDFHYEFKKFIIRMNFSELSSVTTKTYNICQSVPDHHTQVFERHIITIGLSRLLQKRHYQFNFEALLRDDWIYEAMSFVRYFNQVWDKLNAHGKARFKSDVLAGLKYKGDIRPTLHELKASYYFSTHGFNVTYPDYNGTDNFDLLVEKDGVEIEVELKTLSKDTGSKTHRSDTSRFTDRVVGLIESLNIEFGFDCLISLTNRLPSSDEQINELAGQVTSFLKSGATEQTTDLGVFSRHKNNLTIQGKNDEVRLNELLKLGYIAAEKYNAEVHSVCKSSKVLRLLIKSKKPNEFFPSLVKTCKNGARQLTSKRPGIVWVHFNGVRNAEIDFENSQCPFDAVAHYCFRNESRSHIHSLYFSGDASYNLKNIHNNGIKGHAIGTRERIILRRNFDCTYSIPMEIFALT